MLSTEEKENISKRITESKTFKNAPTSIALLQYLIQANIEDRQLKEGIIDIEFFRTKPDSGKSNPKVRVNVYNLRKKLLKYYDEEGEHDTWQLIIDKGQYGVRFEKRTSAPPISIPKYRKVAPYLLAVVLLIILIVSHLPKSKPEIWKDFFDNEHTTSLYIGDAFGFGGKTISGKSGWTRDFSINSLDDYYELLERKPELKDITRPMDLSYSTRMAENATHDLTKFFSELEGEFDLKYATKVSFNDIKKSNVIYVGKTFNQTDFVYLFNERNTNVKILDKKIIVQELPNIPDTTINIPRLGTENDLTIVSRVSGPNQTEQFLFFSNHDIGVMSTVKYFTNPDSIKSFTERHLDGKDNFTAIYLAKGKKRIDLSLEELLVISF
ncbi:hypothetical protein [Reichenbachiella versicolor]|uniref:hypothetical protein n=1 Tax=Reichenbachiella versicolor TaxID=1821036 RepID=UPI000D6E34FF|nr:hypothetical protein [Reichenbachiella versicolor]